MLWKFLRLLTVAVLKCCSPDPSEEQWMCYSTWRWNGGQITLTWMGSLVRKKCKWKGKKLLWVILHLALLLFWIPIKNAEACGSACQKPVNAEPWMSSNSLGFRVHDKPKAWTSLPKNCKSFRTTRPSPDSLGPSTQKSRPSFNQPQIRFPSWSKSMWHLEGFCWSMGSENVTKPVGTADGTESGLPHPSVFG